MSWVKSNHVKRALREGRPTAGAWLNLCSAISTRSWDQARELYEKGYQFLTLGSDTSLVVQGS